MVGVKQTIKNPRNQSLDYPSEIEVPQLQTMSVNQTFLGFEDNQSRDSILKTLIFSINRRSQLGSTPCSDNASVVGRSI